MGIKMEAKCECGYKKDGIYIGGGKLDYLTYDPHPYYCGSCKIMFSGDRLAKKKIFSIPIPMTRQEVVCPECGTDDVIPYFDERICKDDKCICPACGNYTLTFNNDSYILYD